MAQPFLAVLPEANYSARAKARYLQAHALESPLLDFLTAKKQRKLHRQNACATLEEMTFYRRNLPHWHPEGKSIFLTWRLYGSLPASLLKKNRAGPSKLRASRNACATTAPDPEDSPGKQFLELDAALDSAKRGPLWLAEPEFADYAEYPILHGAELGRFRLHAYVVMPNHVHMLLDPFVPLAKISGPLKGVAACDINARLGRTGKPLWQDESFDHWIRNSVEFERIREYIEWNPVRAGLVAQPEDWRWSSAGNPYFKRLVTATPSAAAPIGWAET